ncbi:MAG TPA: hypothetical protein PKI11_12520 [Candidatus Hydrogenedentes bacterium]|nr:hypothetical protein [Candidatus Hydrogenedentota bacterium]
MALFGFGKKDAERGGNAADQTHPIVGRAIYCRICDAERTFTRCWRRAAPVRRCPCCGAAFDRPETIYARAWPACPQCGEPLEQPGFDYGLCDGCGSKFEIMEGTRPGLLPNQQQRKEMEKHGKSWIRR